MGELVVTVRTQLRLGLHELRVANCIIKKGKEGKHVLQETQSSQAEYYDGIEP